MNRIETFRKAKGWSMDQLGARCDPPTAGSVINKLEKGLMQLKVLWMIRLSTALGCHPNDLLDKPAPTVNCDEQEVVELYRGLSDVDQQLFRRVGDGLAKLSSRTE